MIWRKLDEKKDWWCENCKKYVDMKKKYQEGIPKFLLRFVNYIPVCSRCGEKVTTKKYPEYDPIPKEEEKRRIYLKTLMLKVFVFLILIRD